MDVSAATDAIHVKSGVFDSKLQATYNGVDFVLTSCEICNMADKSSTRVTFDRQYSVKLVDFIEKHALCCKYFTILH